MKRRLMLCAALAATGQAMGQLRVASWNVTNYSNTLPDARDPAFKTALYAQYQGRSLAPDVLIAQEFTSPAAAAAFLSLLNSAPGSPGDWAAAPYINGPDTDNAFFYRTSKVTFVAVTTVSLGGSAPEPPRNTERYDIRPWGYGPGATLACYSTHMKAGTTTSDQARRLVEAQRIRDDAGSLPPDVRFLVAGDFNIRSSSEAAYQALVAQQPSAGRFVDPIATPGVWYSNPDRRFVHTQAPGGAPSSTGGMDDRFDQVLLDAGLIDGMGFSYIGSPAIPYSTVTWDDPNHSYRVWGNDGTSYNQALTITGNQMVGPTIAQALWSAATVSTDGGHLPVFLDLRVPPRLGAPHALDFGSVPLNAPAHRVIAVANSGNTALWNTAGIAGLHYTIAATTGFSAPSGVFAASAGSPGNQHVIAMETSELGPMAGFLTITSDDPDELVRFVPLTGTVVLASCDADCDGDGVLTIADFGCFQAKYALGEPYADCNEDGLLNLADFGCFQTRFALGCP
jgi:hypothetical protein